MTEYNLTSLCDFSLSCLVNSSRANWFYAAWNNSRVDWLKSSACKSRGQRNNLANGFARLLRDVDVSFTCAEHARSKAQFKNAKQFELTWVARCVYFFGFLPWLLDEFRKFHGVSSAILSFGVRMTERGWLHQTSTRVGSDSSPTRILIRSQRLRVVRWMLKL